MKLFDEWQDDIVAQNGAIERLNTLASERPKEAQAIIDLISVYVRELASENPLLPLPAPPNRDELRNWGRQLTPARTDLEVAKRAMSTISEKTEGAYASLQRSNFQGHDFSRFARLRAIFDHASLNGAHFEMVNLSMSSFRYTNAEITYLAGANLSGSDCYEARFHGSDLSDANFTNADISEAKLISVDMQNARFIGATAKQTQMQGSGALGADFSHADLRFATLPDYETKNGKFRFDFKPLTGTALSNQSFAHIENPELLFPAYGDASVKLPDGLIAGVGKLSHWANEELGDKEFEFRWRAYQRSIGYTPAKS